MRRFLIKRYDSFSWRRGVILARGKNREKGIGKNKGVQWCSLFYSSLGAGYTPCDARRNRNNSLKNIQE